MRSRRRMASRNSHKYSEETRRDTERETGELKRDVKKEKGRHKWEPGGVVIIVHRVGFVMHAVLPLL